MKNKRKPNLANTICKVHVEFYSFRPADNKYLYSRELENEPFKENSIFDTIKRLEHRYRGNDPYKIRIVYKYYSRKGMKRSLLSLVKTRCTPFYYVRGNIKPKEEVVNYFTKINPEVAEHIATHPGDKLFWCHYEVQPLSRWNNYEILKQSV